MNSSSISHNSSYEGSDQSTGHEADSGKDWNNRDPWEGGNSNIWAGAQSPLITGIHWLQNNILYFRLFVLSCVQNNPVVITLCMYLLFYFPKHGFTEQYIEF